METERKLGPAVHAPADATCMCAHMYCTVLCCCCKSPFLHALLKRDDRVHCSYTYCCVCVRVQCVCGTCAVRARVYACVTWVVPVATRFVWLRAMARRSSKDAIGSCRLHPLHVAATWHALHSGVVSMPPWLQRQPPTAALHCTGTCSIRRSCPLQDDCLCCCACARVLCVCVQCVSCTYGCPGVHAASPGSGERHGQQERHQVLNLRCWCAERSHHALEDQPKVYNSGPVQFCKFSV